MVQRLISFNRTKDNKNIDFLINKDKYSLVSLSTIEEINKFFKNEFSRNSLSLIECCIMMVIKEEDFSI